MLSLEIEHRDISPRKRLGDKLWERPEFSKDKEDS